MAESHPPPEPFDAEMSTNISLKATETTSSSTTNIRHRKRSSFLASIASVEPEVTLKELGNPNKRREMQQTIGMVDVCKPVPTFLPLCLAQVYWVSLPLSHGSAG
jgi:hypothetical protein